MTAKEYVDNCVQFVEDYYVDPYNNVVDIVEERKLDTTTMRYYLTSYIIDGYKYALDEEVERR